MKTLLPIFFGLVLPGLAGELTFETKLEEVEVPLDGRRVTADFKFENKSDEDVAIAKYNATCSCMTVQVKGGKLSYAPGESGVIRGVFDMGNFSGTVDKAVQIWLDGDPEDAPSVTLTTRIHIPVLVDVEPKTLRWDVGGEMTSQTITVTMMHDEPIKVTSVSCQNPNFKIKQKTVEEGKKYELEVTPTDTSSQSIGLISIETDCPIKRHATQRAYTIVRKPG
ncbi:DUF1573 domain-containing protein [Haloferula chungangensis]|uniref:DUF1573 domain-containing protein n=1 Tax=Haloferula chungangensis TaxID=1048331 RepID=A0ABW2LBN6_9BACT